MLLDSRLKNISFSDLEILAELSAHSSLRALGRTLDIEPPKLTKTLQSVSRDLETEIIKTSPHGYVLTSEGSHICLQAKSILDNAVNLFPNKRALQNVGETFTVGSRGFLNLFFASAFLQSSKENSRNIFFRLIDLSPEELRTTAFEGVLDIAVHLEEIQWPQTWTCVEIGKLQWSLYTRKGHPLRGTITKDDLLKYPMTRSAYWNGNSIAQASDSLPIPRHERQIGHEMQTVLTSLEIIRHSDHIALAPDIIAAHPNWGQDLVPLKVSDIDPVTAKVFLSVRSDKVSQKLFKHCQTELRKKINSL